MPTESKTSPRRISAKERQRQALELRKAGATYQKIADTLNYKNPSGAAQAVMSAMMQIIEEPAKEVLKLELERLDAILLSIWKAISQGHLSAIDRGLKIMERRARYLGLDAPVKQDNSLDGIIKIQIVTPSREEEYDFEKEELMGNNGNQDTD